MKRYLVIVFLGLTFLLFGLQTMFVQTATAADRGNAAPAAALPDELQGLDVKDYFVDAFVTPAGFIQRVIGHVVVLHADSNEAFFAANGDSVFKHDVIFTLRDARCRVKFSTDDVITMGENARIDIEEHIDDRQQKKKTSIFNMLRGKVMFYAMRLFKYRNASMSVKTPTAVVGVRGTKFGVEVRMMGADVAQSAPLYLADASGSDFRYLLAAAPPGGIVTDAHCFSGEIDVTALGDNSTETAGAGETRTATSEGGQPVTDTPPDVADSFTADTEVPEPGATGGTGQQPSGGGTQTTTGDTGEGTTPADTDVEDPSVDVNQNLTTIAAGTSEYTGVMQGYFSGMVIHRSGGSAFYTPPFPYIDNVYVSDTRQDFDADSVQATGVYNDYPPSFIKAATGSGLVYVEEVNVDIGAQSGPLGPGWPVTYQEIGHDSYQGWGSWNVANTFYINTFPHDLMVKGYYIFGDPTPDAAVTGISGQYAGPAYGTFFDPAAGAAHVLHGIDMQGGFECFVDGPAGEIRDFNLVVLSNTVTGQPPGYMAAITTPSGEVSGTFNPNSSSFQINDPNEAGMSWLLVIPGTPSPTVVDAYYRDANGSLYGPNGEKIGGVWGMKEVTGAYPNERYVGAQGIFQGAPGTGNVPSAPLP